MDQKPEQLTIDKFYEKTKELNEVFVHNLNEMKRTFMEKQKALWDRLSPEDQAEVTAREVRKQNALRSTIVDRSGKPITTH